MAAALSRQLNAIEASISRKASSPLSMYHVFLVVFTAAFMVLYLLRIPALLVCPFSQLFIEFFLEQNIALGFFELLGDVLCRVFKISLTRLLSSPILLWGVELVTCLSSTTFLTFSISAFFVWQRGSS